MGELPGCDGVKSGGLRAAAASPRRDGERASGRTFVASWGQACGDSCPGSQRPSESLDSRGQARRTVCGEGLPLGTGSRGRRCLVEEPVAFVPALLVTSPVTTWRLTCGKAVTFWSERTPPRFTLCTGVCLLPGGWMSAEVLSACSCPLPLTVVLTIFTIFRWPLGTGVPLPGSLLCALTPEAAALDSGPAGLAVCLGSVAYSLWTWPSFRELEGAQPSS